MMGNHKRVIMAAGVWAAVFSACWAAEEGRRVTVPDDYLTITEAVDKADPNDIIFIRNGTYNEDFSIKKPLTLEGESRDGVIIRAPADKYAVIYVKKHPVTFKNLTLEHSDKETQKNNTSCIRIERSASTVENCLFRNSACYGLVIKYNCQVTVNNSVFENNKSCGIHVFDNFSMPVFTNNVIRNNEIGLSLRKCNGLAEDNQFENNINGVNIGEFRTTLTVRANQFINNTTGVSIWSHEKSQEEKGSFESLWDERNLSSFVTQPEIIIKAYTDKFGSQWPVIENNHFKQSSDSAVLVTGANVLAFLRGNRSENDFNGFCATKGAQLFITDCRAEANRSAGFYSGGKSTFCVLLNSHAYKNGRYGVYYFNKAKGCVIANNVKNNLEAGIFANDVEQDFLIANNQIDHNGDSGLLFIADGPNWRIENNQLSQNGEHGICINDTRHDGIVSHNTCSGNQNGILVLKSSSIQIEKNVCETNREQGILFEQGSRGILKNNQIRYNGYEGIKISDMGSDCIVLDNVLYENYPTGIFFDKQASGRIEGNDCRGHSWAGIALRDVGLEAVVAGNTCNDNGAWGIISYAGAEPVVQDDNIAENNGRGGVKHRPLTPEEKVAAWMRQGRAYVEVKNHLGAIECFRQTLAFVPEHTEALRLLGWACYEEGLKRSGKTASDNFDNAYKAFQQALSTAPHDLQSLYGLAAVMERRTIADDEQKIQTQQDVTQIFEKSLQASPRSLDRITLYSIHNISQANKAQKESALPFLEKTQAVLLQTLLCRKDNAELLSCLGMLYINYSYIVSDKKEDYLQKAEECLTRIDSGGLKTTSGAYNLACVYALQGKEEKCREYLVIAQDNGQLPSREHVMQDRDLASVRNKPWFRELKWPQDEKEPEQLEIPKDF